MSTYTYFGRFVRLCAALLALLMMVGLAAGCKKEPPVEGPGDTPGNSTPGGDTEPPEPDVPKFQLVGEDDVFLYTIVRGERASKSVTRMAAITHTALEDVLNRKDVEIRTDEEDPFRYEILIGKTSRPESEQVFSELGEYQYAIRVMNEGKTIVIIGSDDIYTLMAINVFLKDYVGYDTLTGAFEMKENVSIPLELNKVVTLDDANGYSDVPTIVQTKYETEDTVVADIVAGRGNYGVDPSGAIDSTEGIQKALNDCAARGGGTVFLPAGNYLITDQIKIPSYTVLRGDWQNPDLGTEYGTVIYANVSAKDDMTNGVFLLGASGGAYGLTVYYPEQSLENVKKYPFTFYFQPNLSGNGWHAPTVKNCTVINGYRGAGATCMSEAGHEQMTIENLYGTFLDIGVAIGSSSDVGNCTNITILPKYWSEFHEARGMKPVDTEAVKSYTREHTVGMRLSDVEWTEYIHVTITDCKIGVHIVHAERIGFAGSFYDTVIMDCGVAVQAEELDKRWGAQFSGCYLQGTEYAMVNTSEGIIKTAGTTMIGGLSGDILVDKDSLADYVIDTGVRYPTPNGVLYVADVDKTGQTDVSAQIQALLDEAGKTGGIVYLPGGTYLIDQPITVLEGVELRGTSPVAHREESNYGLGTRVMTHYGVGGSEDDTALITLKKNAGVNGIRFIYTSNHSGIRETSYCIRGTGKGVYVVNCCMILAGRGIDFADCDEHLIKKVTSYCFINDIRVGGWNGTVTGFLHNATVCDRIGFVPESGELGGNMINTNYSNRNEVARDYNTTIWVDKAEGQKIWNAFAYGVAHFIMADQSEGTLAVNIGTDNIGSKTAQLVVYGGDFTAINVLRYNGHSYDAEGGAKVTIYTRLAINDKTEDTVKIK